MVIGRMGRSRLNASQNAPFLKGNSSLVLLLVPSEKKITEVQSLILWLASLIDFLASAVLEPSMKMAHCLAANSYSGVFFNLCIHYLNSNTSSISYHK